jgi:2-keto-4-pentenoate hydratase/2-oxohepta-3-ene-1,7-dioic acid hydratase in catechol pathway
MKLLRFLDENLNVRVGRPARPGFAHPLLREEQNRRVFADEEIAIRQYLPAVAAVNIFAIGRNYRAHVAETGARAPTAPLIFQKPTTALTGHEAAIVLPAAAPQEVDFEAELAVVIGRRARNVSADEALEYVEGYTCANDVSARDCQRNDKQWSRAKGFDTFCPLGPCLVTADEIDPAALPIRSRLNGQVMQDSSTDQMTYSCADLISYLSQQFTLLPGTVILTGTPEGVGVARTPPVFLKPGDTIEVEIDGIGTLVNEVRAAEP